LRNVLHLTYTICYGCDTFGIEHIGSTSWVGTAMTVMNKKKSGRNFSTMAQLDVPQGRNGKHKSIVSAILADLDKLESGAALQVPIEELDDSKENIRSALNRATRKQKRNVATASDAQFIYVWNVAE
jgi:hypothetical protein